MVVLVMMGRFQREFEIAVFTEGADISYSSSSSNPTVMSHLLFLLSPIAKRREPHFVEQSSERPLNLLPFDELLVVQSGVGDGEFESVMKSGVNPGRLETLRSKPVHVGQRVEIKTEKEGKKRTRLREKREYKRCKIRRCGGNKFDSNNDASNKLLNFLEFC